MSEVKKGVLCGPPITRDFALLLFRTPNRYVTVSQRAVMHLKSVVEKGPWMGGLRSGLKLALQGDYGGALVHYSRLAEVRNLLQWEARKSQKRDHRLAGSSEVIRPNVPRCGEYRRRTGSDAAPYSME